MRNWRLLLLIATCIVQLAVPALMLVRHERALAAGEPFRFACAPVDPADPFRGRYVALGFSDDRIDVPAEMTLVRNEKIYVRVERGPDGYGRISEPSKTPHEEGAYLRVRVLGYGGSPRSVELPFDRYYLTEDLAPEAEKAYRERAAASDGETYVDVRILNGRAVIEELYLDDVPVREYFAGE
jgi:uncharacterized membrane-anchored protein